MYLLAANPTAGGGKGREVTKRVVRYLESNSIKFRDISGSSYESASSSLAAALQHKADKQNETVEGVIVIGGDGMAHLAIQSLALSKIPMVFVPAGTGNDLARTLNLPLNAPEALIEKVLGEDPVNIDLGKVGSEYFADILSTGFDSVVNERANRLRIVKGRMKYSIAILFELPLFRPLEYEFVLDGEISRSKAMLIAVANGPCYGGGMQVCPNAEVADGLFDIMILEPISKFEFLRVFPKVFNGTHISHPKVRIRRARKVEVRANAVAYADGERIGNLPITAEVIPRALRTWRF